MAKNILIFSDGTGQAGGLRPDQRLSNIYKLYRATRTGPDSPINPAEQVAFYDAGLGSAEIAPGNSISRAVTWTRKMISSAFGAGLTRNVADCYESILKVYQPEDRIFLFGFSRGAYTVRALAGVMNLCGVPVHDADGRPLPRCGKALRAVVDEAVHQVYEHGAGHPRAKFEAEREEHARRFRLKYRTQNDPIQNVRGNVVPYFIGVFDTVAALGASGPKMIGVAGGILLAACLFGWGVGWLLWLIAGIQFWPSTLVATVALLGVSAAYGLYCRVRIIRDFPQGSWLKPHISGWRFKHYDRFLDPRIRYARHAQAIDETRTDFARVGWGSARDEAMNPPDWLKQVWFAGNHSDIGGSYDETESRLSDIALKWMVDQCKEGVIPNGIKIDWSKLHLFEDASAPQHCEVASWLDQYPRWWPAKLRLGWKAAPRPDVSLANCHPTVRQRFDLPAIDCCGISKPYRPEALHEESELAAYYLPHPCPPEGRGLA